MESFIINITIKIYNLFLKILSKIFFKNKSDKEIKKICIYRVGNIGEFFCTLPALYKIRLKYPKAKITLLTSPGSKKLVGGEMILKRGYLVDEIEVYYNEDIKGKKKYDFIRKQKQKKYDYLINLPAEKSTLKVQIRNIIFFKLLGIEMADGFYISTVNFFKKNQLVKNNYVCEVERLVNGLPFKSNTCIKYPKMIEKKDEEKVEKLFLKYGIKLGEKLMIISHAGKGKAKLWPHENFVEISKKWIEKGGKVIIVGGKDEYKIASNIVESIGNKAYNFCGETNIFESLSLLKKSKFLLTIDTGTAHMASAVGINCVTLFSSHYHRVIWEAFGNRNKIFRKDIECSPCFDKECRNKSFACMKAIKVDEVWEYISKNY